MFGYPKALSETRLGPTLVQTLFFLLIKKLQKFL